jgi:hypothetical protein
MTLRLASTWLVAFGIAASSAWAQEAVTNDVQQGHHLAVPRLPDVHARHIGNVRLVARRCNVILKPDVLEGMLRDGGHIGSPRLVGRNGAWGT